MWLLPEKDPCMEIQELLHAGGRAVFDTSCQNTGAMRSVRDVS